MSHSQFGHGPKPDVKQSAPTAAASADNTLAKDSPTSNSIGYYVLQEISASLRAYKKHLIETAKKEMAAVNQTVIKKQVYKIKILKADAKLETNVPADKRMIGLHEALKHKQLIDTDLTVTESLDNNILNFDAKELDFDTLIRETKSLGKIGNKLLSITKVLALVSGLLEVVAPSETISAQQQIILLKTILDKPAFEFAKQPKRDLTTTVLEKTESELIKDGKEEVGIDLAFYGDFDNNITVANMIKHLKTPESEGEKTIASIAAMIAQEEKLSTPDVLMPLLKAQHPKKNIHHHRHGDHKREGMTLFAKLTKPVYAIQELENTLNAEIKQLHEPINRLKVQIEKYKKDITEKSIVRDETGFIKYCNKNKIIGKEKRNALEKSFRASLKEAYETLPGLETQLEADTKALNANIQKAKADAKSLEAKVTAIHDLHTAAAELNKQLLVYVEYLKAESLRTLKQNKYIYREFMITYEGDVNKIEKDFFGNVSDSDSDDESPDSKSYKKRLAIGKDFEIIQEKLRIMSELCLILKKIENRTSLPKIIAHNRMTQVNDFETNIQHLLLNKEKGLLDKYKQLNKVFNRTDEKAEPNATPSPNPKKFLSQKRRFSFTAAKGENIVDKITTFKTLMEQMLIKAGVPQEYLDLKMNKPETPKPSA